MYFTVVLYHINGNSGKFYPGRIIFNFTGFRVNSAAPVAMEKYKGYNDRQEVLFSGILNLRRWFLYGENKKIEFACSFELFLSFTI